MEVVHAHPSVDSHVGRHTARHTQQIDEVKRSPGFPAADH
jgi:hypothetical protein